MDLRDRIRAKVVVDAAGCWIWQGYLIPNGYARISVGGLRMYAHRASYEAFVGPIPNGLEIDHLCRVRHCANPEHLEPVTREMNVRRGISAEVNRQRHAARTHCKRGHPFDEDNTKRKPRGRSCRACSRDWMRAARARRKQPIVNPT